MDNLISTTLPEETNVGSNNTLSGDTSISGESSVLTTASKGINASSNERTVDSDPSQTEALRIGVWKNDDDWKNSDILFLNEQTGHRNAHWCPFNWLKIPEYDKGNIVVTYIRKGIEASICVTPFYQQIMLKGSTKSVLLFNVSHLSSKQTDTEIRQCLEKWKSEHKSMPFVLYYHCTSKEKRETIHNTLGPHRHVESLPLQQYTGTEDILLFSGVTKRSDQWPGVIVEGMVQSPTGPPNKEAQESLAEECVTGNRIKVTTMNLNAMDNWPKGRNRDTIYDLVQQSPPSDVIVLQEINCTVAKSLCFSPRLDNYIVIIGQRAGQTQPIEPKEQNINLCFGTLLLKKTFKQILKVSLHPWFLLVMAQDYKGRVWFIGNIHMKAQTGPANCKLRKEAFKDLSIDLAMCTNYDMHLIMGDTNIYQHSHVDQPIKPYMDDVWEQLSPDQQQMCPSTVNDKQTRFHEDVRNFTGKDTGRVGHKSRPDRVYLQKERYCLADNDGYEHSHHERIKITTKNYIIPTVAPSDHLAVIVQFEIN